MNDDLGDRMKLYERAEAGRRLMPLLPVIARIDGRAFHAFTRGMERPFDARFTEGMLFTTEALVRETGACMGYAQSDEITLAWHSTSIRSQIWFDGRVAKMTSQLAAQATILFYRYVAETMEGYAERMPTFDARVWNVPNRTEGANVFLWREWDATKNSVSMAAAAHYSHNELMGKNSRDKHDMLMAKGVNWNDYPAQFKRGVYVQRRIESVAFSAAEIENLPPKHAARSDPGLVVERSVVRRLDLPPLGTVTNREAVVFDGVAPEFFVELADTSIDTRDHVFHVPTQETWVVAYVQGDRLAWCGWPEGEVALADCKLVHKATESERAALLESMARGEGRRAAYAQERLAGRVGG